MSESRKLLSAAGYSEAQIGDAAAMRFPSPLLPGVEVQFELKSDQLPIIHVTMTDEAIRAFAKREGMTLEQAASALQALAANFEEPI